MEAATVRTRNGAWRRLQQRFGAVALLTLGILATALLCQIALVRPLETKLERLNDRIARDARRGAAESARAGTPSVKLAAFYSYFEREDGQVEWLARLYGSARGAGLELRSADYRLVEDNGRIARYELTLPLTGSYAQIRAFLADVLDENPVMSLDQLGLRRKRVNDSAIEAEAVLTIHLLRP